MKYDVRFSSSSNSQISLVELPLEQKQRFNVKDRSDYIKYFLDRSIPADNFMDVEFPIAHRSTLKVDNVMHAGLDKSAYAPGKSGTLRPTVRFLSRIGRSLVADQWQYLRRRKVGVRGFKPTMMTDEERWRAFTNLDRTLYDAIIPVARLRWTRANLGGLYENTCIAEGCSFVPYSYEHLCDHLSSGHYNMEELLADFEESIVEALKTPCLYYPANQIEVGKNVYFCAECEEYFNSQMSMQVHFTEVHNVNTTEQSDVSLDNCHTCTEMVDRTVQKLSICTLRWEGRNPRAIWRDIGKYLDDDPARGIDVRSAASLVLFPNVMSPLIVPPNVFEKIQEKYMLKIFGVRLRYASTISAFHGRFYCSELETYTGEDQNVGVCDIVALDRRPVILNAKRLLVLNTPNEENGTTESKRPRIDEEPLEFGQDLKKRFLLAEKASGKDSMERKSIVIRTPFDRPSNQLPQTSESGPNRVMAAPQLDFDAHSSNGRNISTLQLMPNKYYR